MQYRHSAHTLAGPSAPSKSRSLPLSSSPGDNLLWHGVYVTWVATRPCSCGHIPPTLGRSLRMPSAALQPAEPYRLGAWAACLLGGGGGIKARYTCGWDFRMYILVWAFRHKEFASLVPGHGGNVFSMGESGANGPLLTRACLCPLASLPHWGPGGGGLRRAWNLPPPIWSPSHAAGGGGSWMMPPPHTHTPWQSPPCRRQQPSHQRPPRNVQTQGAHRPGAPPKGHRQGRGPRHWGSGSRPDSPPNRAPRGP